MAKCIRRAGIVFFAIFISCLLILSLTTVTSVSYSKDNLLQSNIQSTMEVATKKVTMSGDCDDMANQWNSSIKESIDNNTLIEIVLGNDWVAKSHPTEVKSFGTGIGFGIYGELIEGKSYSNTGMINIPAGARITLDLNGYCINRNLTEQVIEGKAMWVFGELNLIDSSFSEIDLNIINDFSKIDELKCGKIMGGFEHEKSPDSYGGGIRVQGTLNMYGGMICKNVTNALGGGIMSYGGGKVNIYNGIIANNTAKDAGGGIYCYANNVNSRVNLYGGVVCNNTATNAGGGICCPVSVDNTKSAVGISSGVKVVGNTLESGVTNNLEIRSNTKINILDSLIGNGKSSFIGVTFSGTEENDIFTFDYQYGSKNTLSPKVFFIPDVANKAIELKNNEVALVASSNYPQNKVTWKWSGSVSNELQTSLVAVPYTGKPYTISSNLSSIFDSNNVSKQSHTVSEKGTYTFYTSGNYLNPSFTFIIANTTPVKKPSLGQNILLYSGNEIEYLPQDFDENFFEIENNKQTDIGDYIVKIKPRKKCTWEDGSTDAIELNYSIIDPGIYVKDSSGYDYILLKNNERESYQNLNLHHRIDDINYDKFVLGNIKSNTTLFEFINNLKNSSNLLKIYNQEDELIFDGLANNGAISESEGKQIVGTGFKVELYDKSASATIFETIYLSILGDVNGDGRITASDMALVNQIANDNNILSTMPIENRLAAMINNKGGVSNVDSEILNNTICGKIDINLFFSAVKSCDNNYHYLSLKKENGKYIKEISESETNVIGNVSIDTKVSTFKANLATIGIDISQIAIYNNKDVLVTNDSEIVGTGWYIKVAEQRTYISVLGDLNGDGRISASDIMYARELIKGDKQAVQDCVLLSALILNTGNITSADTAVLETIIQRIGNIAKY